MTPWELTFELSYQEVFWRKIFISNLRNLVRGIYLGLKSSSNYKEVTLSPSYTI